MTEVITPNLNDVSNFQNNLQYFFPTDYCKNELIFIVQNKTQLQQTETSA